MGLDLSRIVWHFHFFKNVTQQKMALNEELSRRGSEQVLKIVKESFFFLFLKEMIGIPES